jgi:hypothetical protein
MVPESVGKPSVETLEAPENGKSGVYIPVPCRHREPKSVGSWMCAAAATLRVSELVSPGSSCGCGQS